MKLSDDLAWRGLIKDKTFAYNSWLDTPRTFYHGIDASADSMTIGNLAAMFLARRLIDGGWKAVLLAGGATSLIGDPGGKTEERELKSREEVQKNVEAVKGQINKLFSGKEFALVDNYDWFKDVRYLDFLREVGKSFSMTELMQREFVVERMGKGGSGVSYAEFSYSLVQGYDYLQLYKTHKTELQIGGSDQWGNMLSGVALIRKKEGKEVHALSMPLVVNKATGAKFGKSEEGAVWLDPAKTTPTQFYQFWINVDDGDVEDYLKIFTLLPKERIEQVIKTHQDNPDMRVAQKLLAEEVTKLVHGEAETATAKEHASILTSGSLSPSANVSPSASHSDDYIFVRLPSGVNLIEALVKTDLAGSNTEARRLIEAGGIYLNNDSVQKDITLNKDDYDGGKVFLRRGKKFQNTKLIELD